MEHHSGTVAWVSCVASCGYQARKICPQLGSAVIEVAVVGLQPQCLIDRSCEARFDVEVETPVLHEEISSESLSESVF